MTVKVNSWLSQCQLTLIKLVSTTHFNCKTTPTNDTDYSCSMKPIELFNQSYGFNIMPLVIDSLGVDTHIYIQISAQKQF